MNLNEYQELSTRTANPNVNREEALANWALGLCGESGEFAELVKKHLFHGKELDPVKAKSELGDVLWYLSQACAVLHLSMEEIAQYNIDKLRARYPEKFEIGGGRDRSL